MNIKAPTKILAVTLSLAILAGCSGLTTRVQSDATANAERGSHLARETGQVIRNTKASQPVVYEKAIFIGQTIQKIASEEILPAVFYEPAWFDRSVTSLQEFAERITTRSGIPAKVGQDAVLVAMRSQQSGLLGSGVGTAGIAGGAATAVAPLPAVPGVGMSGPMGMGTGSVQPVRITYSSGNLKGLLDAAAARFGVSWRYQDGLIKFFHMESRTFSIQAVPGDSSLRATVGSSSGNTGASSAVSAGASASVSSTQVATNNTASTQVSSNLSVWNGLRDSIAAMISASGKVVASPATGTITVTETTDVLARVAEFIDTQNGLLGKQVMINATVLRVSNTEKENFGISWNAFWNDLNTKYGMKNTFTPDNGATSLSAAILSASSRWSGTSVVIDALSSQGSVNLETSASLAALNNQPTPIQVGNQTTYIAQSAINTVANAGTTMSLTPGVVSSGFTMTLLPSVMQDGTIIMQFQSDISALKQIRSISSGGVTMEAPELDTRNFLQRVRMKSGETLIISGFEQTDGNANRSGVISPNNFALGGGNKTSNVKEVMVILLTPVVM